jgi:hypothetical protein
MKSNSQLNAFILYAGAFMGRCVFLYFHFHSPFFLLKRDRRGESGTGMGVGTFLFSPTPTESSLSYYPKFPFASSKKESL